MKWNRASMPNGPWHWACLCHWGSTQAESICVTLAFPSRSSRRLASTTIHPLAASLSFPCTLHRGSWQLDPIFPCTSAAKPNNGRLKDVKLCGPYRFSFWVCFLYERTQTYLKLACYLPLIGEAFPTGMHVRDRLVTPGIFSILPCLHSSGALFTDIGSSKTVSGLQPLGMGWHLVGLTRAYWSLTHLISEGFLFPMRPLALQPASSPLL